MQVVMGEYPVEREDKNFINIPKWYHSDVYMYHETHALLHCIGEKTC